jgi:hypothetical protein
MTLVVTTIIPSEALARLLEIKELATDESQSVTINE